VQPESTKELNIDAITQDAVSQDQTVEVDLDSLEANIGYDSLIRELQHAYLDRVAYYRSQNNGALTIEEARAKAYHACKDKEEAKRVYDRIMSYPVDAIDFVDLLEMWPVAPHLAERLWEMLKSKAGDEFESGHLASKAMTPIEYMRTAWQVASYLGLRQSFITEWRPRGGIELSLIDILAQSFLQYQYWVKQSVMRSTTEPRREAEGYAEWKQYKRAEYKAHGWLPGYWDIPYVSERDAIEHAALMADRWNRTYLRTLRNLRDLRRYSVVINNPQQVNIAGDGGSQMNFAGRD
jgi:hypothetical protein